MGKFLKGILGGFSGKVGNVIGAYWRGIDYMRSLPRKSNKPPTEAQLKQRMAFALVAGFLRPIGVLIKVGYQSYKGKQTPMNAAFAYHLEHAVTGIYPNLTMDLPEVIISKGNLLAAFLPDVASSVAGEVTFSWINNAAVGSTDGTDKATVLIYNPTKNLFTYVQAAAIRSALTYTLEVPMDYSTDVVHAWIGFVKANGKEVSDSTYLGTVTVL
jgi:hypothetical protein